MIPATALERRDFLRQAFAAGLVIGLPWPCAAGDEPAREGVSALAQARAEMCRRAAPGVVLVVPNDRPWAVIAQLNRLFGGTVESGKGISPQWEPQPELLRLFARAVFVCATADEVARALGAEAARAVAVRLDPGGAVAELVACDAQRTARSYDEVLVPRLVALLDGPGGRGLEAAAAHQRGAFPELAEQLDGALAGLDAPEYAAREAASGVLLGACDRLGSALVLAALRTESLEARTRIEQVLAAYVVRLGTPPSNAGEHIDFASARLVVPFGARWYVDRSPDPSGNVVAPFGARWHVDRTPDPGGNPCPGDLQRYVYLTLADGTGK